MDRMNDVNTSANGFEYSLINQIMMLCRFYNGKCLGSHS